MSEDIYSPAAHALCHYFRRPIHRDSHNVLCRIKAMSKKIFNDKKKGYLYDAISKIW